VEFKLFDKERKERKREVIKAKEIENEGL